MENNGVHDFVFLVETENDECANDDGSDGQGEPENVRYGGAVHKKLLGLLITCRAFFLDVVDYAFIVRAVVYTTPSTGIYWLLAVAANDLFCFHRGKRFSVY